MLIIYKAINFEFKNTENYVRTRWSDQILQPPVAMLHDTRRHQI